MNRRTIRKYADREVSDEIIADLLDKAAHAPTTGNMQLYSVVLTRDAEGKRLLAPAHFNQPQVEGCSVVLTFCADLNRYSKWCDVNSCDAGFDNFQSFMAAVLDTSMVAQQFNTLAEREGLGVCMLGTTTYNAAEIAQALGLPAGVIPIITLTVGYPAEDGVETGRLPLDAWVHKSSYNDYNSDRIETLYADKEAREDSQKWVEENNARSLAEVFATVRYPRKNNEFFSDKFVEFLKGQGIINYHK